MDADRIEAELEAALQFVRRLVAQCAGDIVQLRVRPEDGAEALDAARGELLKLAAYLDPFAALHVEHELAGASATDDATRRSAIARVENMILSRAETLRRELDD